MVGSTLDPDNFPTGEKRRNTQKGHDTRTLGPSNSSDMAGPGEIDKARNQVNPVKTRKP